MDKTKVRELFVYNLGDLYWKVSAPGRNLSKPAGTVNSLGYRVIYAEGKYYMSHRLVWLYHKGVWPNGEIDHINRERADNRIENLREATRQENVNNSMRNATGITKVGNKWRAQLGTLNTTVYLGHYNTKEKAREVYLATWREWFGMEFPNKPLLSLIGRLSHRIKYPFPS